MHGDAGLALSICFAFCAFQLLSSPSRYNDDRHTNAFASWRSEQSRAPVRGALLAHARDARRVNRERREARTLRHDKERMRERRERERRERESARARARVSE